MRAPDMNGNQSPSVRVSLETIFNKVEATEDIVSGMRSDFRSLANHSERIRKLESQMSGVLIVNGLVIAAISAVITSLVGGLIK